MKKVRLFLTSVIAGACITAGGMAYGNHNDYSEEYMKCLRTCQGSCTYTGRCFLEER